MSSGVRGGRVALVLVLAAVAAIAAPAGTDPDPVTPTTANVGGEPDVPSTDPRPPGPAFLLQGRPSVRVDKNCYFPEEAVLITLRNVGAGRLFYDAIPNYEIVSPVFGTVRMILTDWVPADFFLRPGESKGFIWTQQWLAEDADGNPIHVAEFAPEGEYEAQVKVLLGSSVQTIGKAPFLIGACNVQVNAGEDVAVDEGQTFILAPDVSKTGPGANITSVTWDTNPTLDGNGDGNPANDADLVGLHPEASFGDDGIYPITLNVRGFLPNATVGVKQDVVFTIDSSGSMGWNDPFDLRKDAAKGYVDLLVPSDRGAVVDFDENAILVNDHHLSIDYERVREDIDLIDSFGGTFLSAGLEAALDELQFFGDPDHLGVIIFLTDAESIFEDDDILIPLVIARAQSLGIRIYTIGLNVPLLLQPLMQRIADETGGKFYTTPDPATLFDIYQEIANEVRKTRGSFFLASDTLSVTVANVAPAAVGTLDLTPLSTANATLRVAGEKWHDVTLVMVRDGEETGRVSIVRMPGSPDEQAATLTGVVFLEGSATVGQVLYTPEDDPVNGQPNGANPVWVTLRMDDGTEITYHHTFNVQHPGTYVWDVDFAGVPMTGGALRASITTDVADPGSDDILISIDWGDGTIESRSYFADGFGPDPFPSPGGRPVSLTDLAVHEYVAAGTYLVTLTVADDDGGITVLSFTVDA